MASHAQKTRRVALIMALLLLILLSIIATFLWQDKKLISAANNATIEANELRIQRPGYPELVMQRQTDDQWLLQEPCALALNEQRLKPLLAALQPAVHFYDAADVDLDAAGLKSPLSTLILNKTTILIGATDLQGDRRYLQRDDRVEFAPEWIQSLIDGGISALANLSLFDFDFNQVSAAYDDGSTAQLSILEPAQWQEITAQQVVSWPINNEVEQGDPVTLTFDTPSTQRQASVHSFKTFTAVKFHSQQCAYILPADTLPVVFAD